MNLDKHKTDREISMYGSIKREGREDMKLDKHKTIKRNNYVWIYKGVTTQHKHTNRNTLLILTVYPASYGDS